MITVGIDEVGRGCWAGPLVAGAVILGEPISGLADSKVLTKISRQKLAGQINQKALAVGLGWVDAATIDAIGLTAAVRLAMERAIDEIQIKFDDIIIDGNFNFLDTVPHSRAIIKADGTIPSVSAASIIAKVARDAYMTELSYIYPGYGFEQHVGYGTALHIAQLRIKGATDIHRLSYKPIKALVQ